VRRRRENFANSPLYKAVLPSKINGVECAAGAKKLQNHTSTTRIYLLKPAILSAPQARKFYKSPLYKADLPSKINDIECAAGAKILLNRPSTTRIYLLKSTILNAPQARKFCEKIVGPGFRDQPGPQRSGFFWHPGPP